MSKIVAGITMSVDGYITGRGTYEAAGHWGGANPWDVHYRVKR